ncbi:MAG: PilT/PilU family type 4a pilus ATPase [Deltaproteobacteria bacterium]|nr:PilT/PilU family type 4a pilus ATPase [Deltaproteobacteria bacterium]
MLDITKLLELMIEHDASDLYITVDSPPAYRVNGVVRPAGNRVLTPDETASLAMSLMSEKQQREFEATNEQNLAIYYSALGRFRVNVFRQRGCVGVVIRQIKTSVPTIEELNLPSIFKDVSMSKRGLVLVVGATGSGKSTTLAAMMDYRNSSQAGHIITIENPIEFVHQHKRSIINQREIGMDTDNYHIALKNALRQAPDVILIGEIRDTETMEAALTFSETGHLCLATLHSNNSNQAIERVLGFFPAERHVQIYMQLSLNLRAIISQRLVRCQDGNRTAAVEVMLASPRIRDLIQKAKIDELKEAVEKSNTVGMQSFDQHLFQYFKEGKITLEEALRNADSANNLRLKIKLADEGSFDNIQSAFGKTPDEDKPELRGETKLTLDKS